MRLRVVAAGTLLLLMRQAAARADPARFSLRMEAGAEEDTNPGRIEKITGVAQTTPIVSAPLARLVLSGDLVASVGTRQSVSLSAAAAGKWFGRSEVRGEDLLVGQASGSWSVLVGPSTSLGLGGAYYDVLQRAGENARDFRSVTPMLRLEQQLQGGVVAAGGGYRSFRYKPDDHFSFSGPAVSLAYRRFLAPAPGEAAADWEWSLGTSLEWRGFVGRSCTTADECLTNPDPDVASGPARRDHFFTGHLEVTRTGDFLAGAGLAAHVNRSNSYGESLSRGLAHVRAGFLLPANISLTGRAEVVYTRYTDSIPLAPSDMSGTPMASIEDESRSTLRIELVRPLGRVMDLGARYTFYSNAIGRPGAVDFQRQTFLVFAAFGYGNAL